MADAFDAAWHIAKEEEESPAEAPKIDQRLVDMADSANGWGSMLAYKDHHESVFEDHTSDLEGDDYWNSVESAESLHDKIWQAGLKALGLKPSEYSFPDELPYFKQMDRGDY